MKLESKLWCKIRDSKYNKSLFLQRIETSTGIGIPDLYWHCNKGNRLGGWVELKVVNTLIKNKLVKLDRKKFTMIQRAWAKKYYKNGGIIFLVIGVYLNERWEIFWLLGEQAYLFVEADIDELREMAYHIGEDFPLIDS